MLRWGEYNSHKWVLSKGSAYGLFSVVLIHMQTLFKLQDVDLPSHARDTPPSLPLVSPMVEHIPWALLKRNLLFLLSQNTVRTAGITALNAWHKEIGLVSFIEGEVIFGALSTENPNLRTEVRIINN